MRNQAKRTQSIICWIVGGCLLLSCPIAYGMVRVTGGQIWPLNYIIPVVCGLFAALIGCLLMRFAIRKLSTRVFVIAVAAVFAVVTGGTLVCLAGAGWIAF